ncbi:hypothetical protein HKX48_000088 [Thoreauomyces humboldtii]|nr:hypothetical protein HKX48_000088 [Thoreauomyces humboldtii]
MCQLRVISGKNALVFLFLFLPLPINFITPQLRIKSSATPAAAKRNFEIICLGVDVFCIQEDNLSTQGDTKTLTRRHAEFIRRHNANVDAGSPRSANTVLREVAEWERLTTPGGAHFTHTQGHEETEVTGREREEHARVYDDQYKVMIERLKEGAERKKRKREEEGEADLASGRPHPPPSSPGLEPDGESGSGMMVEGQGVFVP